MIKGLRVFVVGGNGAIATTVYAGIAAALNGIYSPTGLLTELEDFKHIPFLKLDSLQFSGWDLKPGNPFDWAKNHGIISESTIDSVQPYLSNIVIKSAPDYRLSPTTKDLIGLTNSQHCETALDVIQKIQSDIAAFRNEELGLREIMVFLNSTEPPVDINSPALQSASQFTDSIKNDDPVLTQNMLYAYAAVSEGCGIINFTPNTVYEFPALIELASKANVPICGRDGKTGQTLYKTVLSSMFRWRDLRVSGWFSTNILGGGDGNSLGDPANLESKVISKTSVLGTALGYDVPNHLVTIHNYPLRGDCKESWDVIDFTGWLGAKMSMRINWQGQDSPLAAPLIVDLLRLVHLLWENDRVADTFHLAAYFKTPFKSHLNNFSEQIEDLKAMLSEKKWK